MGVVLVSDRILQGPAGSIHDYLHEIVEVSNFVKIRMAGEFFYCQFRFSVLFLVPGHVVEHPVPDAPKTIRSSRILGIQPSTSSSTGTIPLFSGYY